MSKIVYERKNSHFLSVRHITFYFLISLKKFARSPKIFLNSQPSKGIFNDFIKVVEVCEEFSQSPSMDLIQKFNEISRDFYSRLQGIISVTGKSEQYLASLRKVDQTD